MIFILCTLNSGYFSKKIANKLFFSQYFSIKTKGNVSPFSSKTYDALGMGSLRVSDRKKSYNSIGYCD